MRFSFAIIGLVVLTTVPASAERYRPFNIITGGAYTDRQESTDRWKISGSWDSAQSGTAAALYRAAEVTAKAGSPAFRIVKQQVHLLRTEYRMPPSVQFRETTKLTIRIVRTPETLLECEMPVASNCMTMSVAEVMARFGAQLNQPTRPAVTLATLAFAVPHLSLRTRPVPRALPVSMPIASVPAPVSRIATTPYPAPRPRTAPATRGAAGLGGTSWTPLPPPPSRTPL